MVSGTILLYTAYAEGVIVAAHFLRKLLKKLFDKSPKRLVEELRQKAERQRQSEERARQAEERRREEKERLRLEEEKKEKKDKEEREIGRASCRERVCQYV